MGDDVHESPPFRKPRPFSAVARRCVSTPARQLPGVSFLRGSHLPGASLRADEFDALMADLVPKVRMLQPHLTDVEVLRAAARMAEYRLADERTLMDISFRAWG